MKPRSVNLSSPVVTRNMRAGVRGTLVVVAVDVLVIRTIVEVLDMFGEARVSIGTGLFAIITNFDPCLLSHFTDFA